MVLLWGHLWYQKTLNYNAHLAWLILALRHIKIRMHRPANTVDKCQTIGILAKQESLTFPIFDPKMTYRRPVRKSPEFRTPLLAKISPIFAEIFVVAQIFDRIDQQITARLQHTPLLFPKTKKYKKPTAEPRLVFDQFFKKLINWSKKIIFDQDDREGRRLGTFSSNSHKKLARFQSGPILDLWNPDCC